MLRGSSVTSLDVVLWKAIVWILLPESELFLAASEIMEGHADRRGEVRSDL